MSRATHGSPISPWVPRDKGEDGEVKSRTLLHWATGGGTCVWGIHQPGAAASISRRRNAGAVAAVSAFCHVLHAKNGPGHTEPRGPRATSGGQPITWVNATQGPSSPRDAGRRGAVDERLVWSWAFLGNPHQATLAAWLRPLPRPSTGRQRTTLRLVAFELQEGTPGEHHQPLRRRGALESRGAAAWRRAVNDGVRRACLSGGSRT